MRLGLLLLSFISTVLCTQVHAQSSARVLVRFVPVVDERPLSLTDEAGKLTAGGMGITMMRCYIAGIALWRDGTAVWQEPGSYHLLDAENPETLVLQLQAPVGLQYDAIHFNLGIDSATSTSGAHGGDLDPVKGMYWAWQSGYINFKLEGVSPMSIARKHQFQFHLGGYQSPYAAQQPVKLAVLPADELVVKMDLSQFLSGIDMATQNSITIPGSAAAALSKKAAAIFHTQ